MISKASNVSTYFAELPADRRAPIKKLRALCKKFLTGFEECIEYGMPCYKRNGVIGFSFASQRQYIALYAPVALVREFRDKLSASSIGKSCIRFTNPENLNFTVIQQLLRAIVKSKSAAC